MAKRSCNVGQVRQQSALKAAETPVVVNTLDPKLKELVSRLKVVAVYPDTTDGYGHWPNGGFFVVELALKEEK